MKFASGMLCLCAAIVIACSAPAFAISDREHERYLAKYPEYAEADRQLNEAWRAFKKVATPEHYKAMLKEQRFWLKHKDEMVAAERENDEVYAQAAARVVIERTQIINSVVLAYDRDYAAVHMKHEAARNEHGSYVKVIPVGTKPVDVEPYEGSFYGKTRYGKVENAVYEKFDDIQKSYKNGLAVVRSFDSMRDYEDIDSIDSYRLYNYGDIYHAIADKFVVTFENEKLSCVSHLTSEWLGDAPERLHPCRSILYDVSRDKFIHIEDLFENRQAALNIIIGRAMSLPKMAAMLDETEQYKNVYTLNAIENICKLDLNTMYIENGKFVINMISENTAHYFWEEDSSLLRIDFRDLEPAGLRMEYFR